MKNATNTQTNEVIKPLKVYITDISKDDGFYPLFNKIRGEVFIIRDAFTNTSDDDKYKVIYGRFVNQKLDSNLKNEIMFVKAKYKLL